MRNLWYAFAAPFALAQDGYAVIGPDYAGLGIDKSWDGSLIAHQYGIAQVGARDALYGLQAAWEAFPGKLTKDFVTMGHSQGGGVAWAVAEQLALRTDEFDSGKFGGYRGTIAGSPVVDLFGSAPSLLSNVVGVGVSSIFHDFTLDLWLTPLGLARNKLWTSIKGGIGASQQLFLNGDVTKDNYTDQSWHAAAFEKLANPGRKDFKGPLLVLEGTEDAYVSYEGVKATVEDTCAMFPDNDLELLVVNGTGHTPTLDATRPRWLRWIQDRFENKPVRTAGCRTSHMTSWLPIEQYLAVGGYFTQWVADAKYNYQAVLGL
jgi:pimeloyl-ACP methyl ester carboxylesterase